MAGGIRLWPMILNAGKRFRKLSPEEQEKTVNEFKAPYSQKLCTSNATKHQTVFIISSSSL